MDVPRVIGRLTSDWSRAVAGSVIRTRDELAAQLSSDRGGEN